MSRLLPFGALLALLTVASGVAQSQSTTNVNYNIAAGLSLPTSTFSDRNDAGYHFIAGIGMSQPASALGFRAEGIYNEFNQKFSSDKAHAGGITGNVTYNLMQSSRGQANTLYVIGGIGYYSTREPAGFGNPSQSNTGFNIGGGFRFPLSGFSAYLEARYHTISNADVSFLPISFGVVF